MEKYIFISANIGFSEEKAAKVFQEQLDKLERMSQTEIESLSEDDKRLYINVILSRKNHEAISRRREYEDKILKIKERKSVRFRFAIYLIFLSNFYSFFFCKYRAN